MQQMPNQTRTPARTDCIGCADCKGLCLELLSLSFLPETILKPAAPAR
jgi:hypothetical protein